VDEQSIVGLILKMKWSSSRRIDWIVCYLIDSEWFALEVGEDGGTKDWLLASF
jgi:hypothetical protein